MYACDRSCLERLIPLQPVAWRTSLAPFLSPCSLGRTLLWACIAVFARASAHVRFVGKRQDECRAKPRRIGEMFEKYQTVRDAWSSDDSGIPLMTTSACCRHWTN